MADSRMVGHAIRRRMGWPPNHFQQAVPNPPQEKEKK